MFNIGIVGATGLVGQEILKLINKRNIKYTDLKLAASSKKVLILENLEYNIEKLDYSFFKNLDIVIFASTNDISKKYIPFCNEQNIICIDNSSAYRMNNDIPLVVPEINIETLHIRNSHNNIISNPNCATIILCMSLFNIFKEIGLSRIEVTTYQSVSGGGKKMLENLIDQSKNCDNIKEKQIIYNVFSHDSNVNSDTYYNGEEEKIMQETKKILGDKELKITATCIRVPVMRSHCESITITTKKRTNLDEITKLISNTSGVIIENNHINNEYPESIKSTNKNEILVGRLRKDLSQKDGFGFHMFVSGDQLLKGAALNAIQILEYII